VHSLPTLPKLLPAMMRQKKSANFFSQAGVDSEFVTIAPVDV
jgi:hypothetical protein